jgi:hypothetical protein
MGKEKYIPSEKEPHIHIHKGGATFTDTRHKHKDLVDGSQVRKANCQAVYDDLKDGNAREKEIAEYILKEYLS